MTQKNSQLTLPVLNYSFLRDFKNCPHKAFRRYVVKDIQFTATKKMDEGRADHDALANRLKRGVALDRHLRHAEPICAVLDALPERVKIKIEWFGGINSAGEPCAWDAKDCWFRTKPDVAVITPAGGWLIDWKTGRRWEDPFELETQAMLLSAHHPETRIWQGEYYWLADESCGERYTLAPIDTYDNLMNTAGLMHSYLKAGKWPKQPNKLCNWCNVRDCEHAPK